jgi:LacI family transcriptional regulator
MKKGQQTTLKSIADKLDVSVSTVSRVLSGQGKKYRISQKTATAIQEEAGKLDFTPNQLARGLRLKKTHTIGLVIPDISNPFFSTLARHVEMESRKSGYGVFLCDTEENTEIEVQSLNYMRTRKVDGVIISPVGLSGDHLARMHEGGLPIVVVDRYFPTVMLPYVTSDNFKGALEGVVHLLENGHRVVACIQGILDSAPNRDRVRGYQAAHEQFEVKVDANLIVGDNFGERNGYIQMKLLLSRAQRPTAIFSVGNLITLGALRAIAEEGLTVPDDISIVSFDEQPYSGFLATPMTTISQQNEAMGQIAVSLLLGQMEAKGHPESEGILLPTRLIKRESVRRLP